jgi:hypothetical protein
VGGGILVGVSHNLARGDQLHCVAAIVQDPVELNNKQLARPDDSASRQDRTTGVGRQVVINTPPADIDRASARVVELGPLAAA